jgi:site-specific DNA recombinase
MNSVLNLREDTQYVAFYSRVSTDEIEQLNSLKNQPLILQDYISKNPNWELYESYIDEGISGLSISKRLGFRKMLSDAERGKFQILIVKSVSRFGRNMTDTNTTLDFLLKIGIRVIFIEDNIDSINRTDLEKFGLYSWLAENESRKISERVTGTLNKLQKDGAYLGRTPFGYIKKGNKLEIKNEQESNIIKEIYSLYLRGNGAKRITDIMNEKYLSYRPNGWNSTMIRGILTNTVYIGDTHTRMFHTVDIKQRKRVKTKEEDREYFHDTHPAIIDRKTFAEVQTIKGERYEMSMQHQKQSSVHIFSNLIVCGRCGSSYIRQAKKGRTIGWSCVNYETYGKKLPKETETRKPCTKRVSIKEDDLSDSLEAFFRNLQKNKEKLIEMAKKEQDFIDGHKGSIKKQLDELNKDRDKLRRKLERLLDLYEEDEITKKQYLERSKPVDDQIFLLSKRIKDVENIINGSEENNTLFESFLSILPILCDRKKWTNNLLKKYLSGIIIYTKEEIDVIIKLQKKAQQIRDFENENVYLSDNDNSCHHIHIGTMEFNTLNNAQNRTIKAFVRL